jgi:hypothetical protein
MTLKRILSVLALTLLTLAPGRARAAGGVETDPAYLPIDKAIDPKTLRPEVDVNLPRFLLQTPSPNSRGGPTIPSPPRASTWPIWSRT